MSMNINSDTISNIFVNLILFSGFSISDDDAYAFYYPLSMVSNQLAQVCLEINQNLLPVRVKVTFPNSTYDGKSCGCHTANSGKKYFIILILST